MFGFSLSIVLMEQTFAATELDTSHSKRYTQDWQRRQFTLHNKKCISLVTI